MKSSNPALNQTIYINSRAEAGSGGVMTVQGTVNKTGVLLLCAFATAAYAWDKLLPGSNQAAAGPLIMVGAFGGLIMAMVTIFKKQWAAITAPVYALLEGLVLGAFSAIMELRYPGIATEAVALTFGTCLAMLLAYSTGFVKPTERFKLGVFAATGGITLVYLLSFVLSLFHVPLPFLYGSGSFSILFSLVVVVIAALNLVIDFDFIQQGALRGAPKYMEWYSAFGLMVTLVWLYLEMLRLLSKLRDRR